MSSKKKAKASKVVAPKKLFLLLLGLTLLLAVSYYIVSAKFLADSKVKKPYSFTINQTNETKWLSFRVVDKKTKVNAHITIKGYVDGKTCNATTSSTSGGCLSYKGKGQTFNINQDGAGFYREKFTIVETVEVKNGKTYKRYYLSRDGKIIISKINILDPKGKVLKTVSPSFPLGTTLEKAKKYNFGGKAISIGVDSKKY